MLVFKERTRISSTGAVLPLLSAQGADLLGASHSRLLQADATRQRPEDQGVLLSPASRWTENPGSASRRPFPLGVLARPPTCCHHTDFLPLQRGRGQIRNPTLGAQHLSTQHWGEREASEFLPSILGVISRKEKTVLTNTSEVKFHFGDFFF